MLQKYLYVSGKSKLSQFNYSVRFWESKMIVRVLPVEQNWRGRGGRRKKKEKVNEAHLSGRNTILRLIRLALNRAGRHRTHWFATGERSSKEAAVFASMKKKGTCKKAKQVYNQRVWSVLAEQIFYTCQNVILEEQQDAFHFIHKSHRLLCVGRCMRVGLVGV